MGCAGFWKRLQNMGICNRSSQRALEAMDGVQRGPETYRSHTRDAMPRVSPLVDTGMQESVSCTLTHHNRRESAHNRRRPHCKSAHDCCRSAYNRCKWAYKRCESHNRRQPSTTVRKSEHNGRRSVCKRRPSTYFYPVPNGHLTAHPQQPDHQITNRRGMCSLWFGDRLRRKAVADSHCRAASDTPPLNQRQCLSLEYPGHAPRVRKESVPTPCAGL